MFKTTTMTAAPISQEQEHHQSRKDGPEHALSAHVLRSIDSHRAIDRIRAQLDILG